MAVLVLCSAIGNKRHILMRMWARTKTVEINGSDSIRHNGRRRHFLMQTLPAGCGYGFDSFAGLLNSVGGTILLENERALLFRSIVSLFARLADGTVDSALKRLLRKC